MPAVKEAPVETYENAIRLLNSTQSGHKVLAERRRQGQKLDSSALRQMRQWLGRLGYTPGDLNRLNILHVAGTKGKGTTCAFTQSILQQFQDTLGVPKKIGLYTSPHLVSVRERIRINSTAISEDLFTKYFFEVWNALGLPSLNSYWEDGQFETRKPTYFRFLTLMAFHVFMQEDVDVAIIEVGVGGELDSTNIIEKPVAVAITTLGIDHVQTLGGTIEEIAWHKAGVTKNGCPAFTIEQVPEAMRVLEARAQEKDAQLIRVSAAMIPQHLKIRPDEEYQRSNASIAVALARAVIDKMEISVTWCPTDLPTPVINGLENLITTNSTKIAHGTNVALPNGINMTVESALSNALTSSGSSLSYNGTTFTDAELYDYFGIYLDMPRGELPRPKAIEVLFHWCINTYEPEIKDNTLNMKLVFSHTEIQRGDAVAPTWSDEVLKNVTYLTSPADEAGKYVFGGSGLGEIWNLFNNSLSGFSADSGSNQFSTGSDMLINAGAVATSINESTEAWLEVIDGMARNIANGLTNSLFAPEPNVKGTAWQNEVYVQVRWPWLVLLAAQILVSIICLLLVMMETARADMDVVKSSTIAALFAISAEEKADLKRRLEENSEHLIGREDDSRLAPLSIRGELRKRGGEWVVGNP
ncbi:hypothetical protein CkaCkLH20_09961 [Colletotrichum karsti]|uniref:tetrahydrofolate synthase n=1 Tax=Colletotrichum karsti TaxID=1095194 RepID=A0A9P6HXN9_9PEZI|nr:uncharacterized protein CkaCkLH20_09961 [Colletotrichum karsti]KAF9872464.1 hypothetical protein CkaCkLH20_09961 [Colletotrichum karsti]